MFIDGAEIQNDTEIVSDLCIIGSGPAGLTLAKQLHGIGKKITILEQGDLDFSSNYSFALGFASGPVVSHDSYMQYSRRCGYGGTGSHWGGRAHPLMPLDFSMKHLPSVPSWPLSHSEMIPYYKRACLAIDVRPWQDSYYDKPLVEYKDPRFDSNVLWQGEFHHGPKVFRFHNEMKETIAQSDCINLIYNAPVVNLSFNKETQIIEKVQIRNLQEKSFTLKSKIFLLCSGALANPQILLFSNDVEPAGIGNRTDLVGRFFMEHPHSYFSQNECCIKIDRNFMDIPQMSHMGHYPGLFLKEEFILEHGILNGGLTLEPSLNQHNISQLDLFFSESGRPFLTNNFYIGEQIPSYHNRITLSDELDDVGRPQASLKITENERTTETIHQLLEQVSKLLVRGNFGRMLFKILENYKLKDGCHPMGTTRMAHREEDGVVDPNCRVFGTKNLFISGSSVFCSSGFANPTLSIVAFAIRLADHIKKII